LYCLRDGFSFGEWRVDKYIIQYSKYCNTVILPSPFLGRTVLEHFNSIYYIMNPYHRKLLIEILIKRLGGIVTPSQINPRGHVHIHVATHNVESTLTLKPTHPPYKITSSVAVTFFKTFTKLHFATRLSR
jgi:hypothetical protein